MPVTTAIIQRDSVTEMIAHVKLAVSEVIEASALLVRAKKRLASALGDNFDRIIPTRFYDMDLGRLGEQSTAIIERNAWKSIVSRLQVREIVSIKKRQELDDQLDNGELPPLAEANVMAFMEGLFADMGSLLEDSATEVFNWLRPTWRRDLKTNLRNEFGITGKVIVTSAMQDVWGGGMPRQVNHYCDAQFHALDNVFHLLDGRGVAKYPDDICTMVNAAGKEGKSWCETTYFRLKWFRNRNMHIEFKRMDLVAKLNALAGSDKLRGAGIEAP